MEPCPRTEAVYDQRKDGTVQAVIETVDLSQSDQPHISECYFFKADIEDAGLLPEAEDTKKPDRESTFDKKILEKIASAPLDVPDTGSMPWDKGRKILHHGEYVLKYAKHLCKG
jgi:hypothetical protein